MVVVELDLLDIEDSFRSDDTGEQLQKLVALVLNDCIAADRYFETAASSRKRFSLCFSQGKQSSEGENRLSEQLRTNVSCCLRLSDKYLRLLSIVMKSREFHMAYPATEHPRDHDLPIIDLPKSKEGKPFIPTPTHHPSPYEFNVSHQHPYIGIARARGIPVGLDIFTFEEINNRLYSNEAEFVNVFRSSFNTLEWDLISTSKTMYFEFALRWAIKEAYTKSLGLGMSLNFQSFVTSFDIGVQHLWDHVSVHADPIRGIVLRGIVQHSDNHTTDQCSFFFYLIEFHGKMRGCVCICIPDCTVDTVNLRWFSLAELVSFHNTL